MFQASVVIKQQQGLQSQQPQGWQTLTWWALLDTGQTPRWTDISVAAFSGDAAPLLAHSVI